MNPSVTLTEHPTAVTLPSYIYNTFTYFSWRSWKEIKQPIWIMTPSIIGHVHHWDTFKCTCKLMFIWITNLVDLVHYREFRSVTASLQRMPCWEKRIRRADLNPNLSLAHVSYEGEGFSPPRNQQRLHCDKRDPMCKQLWVSVSSFPCISKLQGVSSISKLLCFNGFYCWCISSTIDVAIQ